jgi:hypothetical protein
LSDPTEGANLSEQPAPSGVSAPSSPTNDIQPSDSLVQDKLVPVRLLLLVGGLSEAQKEALSTDSPQPLADLAAGFGIPEAWLNAVTKVAGEIQLADLVVKHKGLTGEEAEILRSEMNAFGECQRMAAEAGKHISLVKFLVMQQLATLPEIDGALIASGAVRRALTYMGDAAPPRAGARTSLTSALSKNELAAYRDASAAELQDPILSRTSDRATSASGKKPAWTVRCLVAGAITATVFAGGYVLYEQYSGSKIIHTAIYRDIDFNDFPSDANRRQHLVNLAGLCQIMDACARRNDGEGVRRSREAIAEYVGTVKERDPDCAAAAPVLYRQIMAYGERGATSGK